jgi:hypothetical protein
MVGAGTFFMSRTRKQRDWPSSLPPKPIPGEWKEESKGCWTCHTGFENFHVTVVNGHINYPGQWVWTCHQIGKSTELMVAVKTLEEAKIVAMTAVCAWLIEAMTAMDRVRKKMGMV